MDGDQWVGSRTKTTIIGRYQRQRLLLLALSWSDKALPIILSFLHEISIYTTFKGWKGALQSLDHENPSLLDRQVMWTELNQKGSQPPLWMGIIITMATASEPPSFLYSLILLNTHTHNQFMPKHWSFIVKLYPSHTVFTLTTYGKVKEATDTKLRDNSFHTLFLRSVSYQFLLSSSLHGKADLGNFVVFLGISLTLFQSPAWQRA